MRKMTENNAMCGQTGERDRGEKGKRVHVPRGDRRQTRRKRKLIGRYGPGLAASRPDLSLRSRQVTAVQVGLD